MMGSRLFSCGFFGVDADGVGVGVGRRGLGLLEEDLVRLLLLLLASVWASCFLFFFDGR